MLRFDERFLSMRSWITAALASIVTPVCQYPYGHNTCRCHQQMGNEFYNLPIDRCLYGPRR